MPSKQVLGCSRGFHGGTSAPLRSKGDACHLYRGCPGGTGPLCFSRISSSSRRELGTPGWEGTPGGVGAHPARRTPPLSSWYLTQQSSSLVVSFQTQHPACRAWNKRSTGGFCLQTSCFGLAHGFNKVQPSLQLQRVLKPGGSLALGKPRGSGQSPCAGDPSHGGWESCSPCPVTHPGCAPLTPCSGWAESCLPANAVIRPDVSVQTQSRGVPWSS